MVRPQTVVILGLITFLVMSVWGIYSMPVDEHGKMASCPFMDWPASLCQMSFTEHVTQWQQLFIMTREQNLFLSAPALLILFLAVLFPAVPRIRNRLVSQEFHNYFYKYRPEMKLFNYLFIVLSQGILNPRIYV